ncbi:CHAP domain-containing protein [Caulobacter mirabilis]|uniref:CHAP domain-containing protein n=1 Tax=Caulobacter mirabilis TaxID=69666 RepID=A0A2D2B2S5_9CAUL|nr:CHAP domain-containing protein [Caulobacter mirabilis]ATQ44516.1 CHAP domain-containing protein [Caulobacter mirabilis]
MRQRTRALLGSLAAAAVMSLAPTANALADNYWQCVPFARLLSGIQIYGDARTWWGQAVGKYETGRDPRLGAVLAFKPTGKMQLGHVAVVSHVLTDRVIQITHANWSRIGGARGQIERDVTVIDVSPLGDWSQVKVWYDPIRDIGTSTYPTHGFIYQNAQAQRLAQTDPRYWSNQGIQLARAAANQAVNGVNPLPSPMGVLNQAADATDRIAALIQAATSQGQTASAATVPATTEGDN